MVVSGSMMLPVSQAPSFCTCGASSSHHKKFENSLSTEEEDLVPAMEDEVDGEEEKFLSFCRLLGSPLRGSVPGSGQAPGRLHPGGYVLGPKAQYPLLVTGKSSSPPAGVEPGSMTIDPQGSNQ
ncbi:hypothetical protein DY000_02012237 [Brassica cretica]|uniref:Uncharacterized protein n=1 Tax=Brassica cretica TaxID=69181 RepID=A0ABQ7CL49_BRACR|nr:hypothetical protein DY000_02012237 [Brassica cretica]